MKATILTITTFLVVETLFSQPQPQGNFHQQLFKKNEVERTKRAKGLQSLGVILFSSQEIPRLGNEEEITPILSKQFRRFETMWARVYLAKHLGGLPEGMPRLLIYKMMIENRLILELEIKEDAMPMAEWSSWLIQINETFKTGIEKLPPEPHPMRLEIWSCKSQLRDGSEKLLASGECQIQP